MARIYLFKWDTLYTVVEIQMVHLNLNCERSDVPLTPPTTLVKCFHHNFFRVIGLFPK
jgi:hypothetical protein